MSGLGPMFVTTKHEAWAKWWHGVEDRAQQWTDVLGQENEETDPLIKQNWIEEKDADFLH